MIAAVALQVVTFISGFLVKGLILNNYGTEINGLVSTVTNINDYLNLVSAGLGMASITALYGPLSSRNWDEINGVMSATDRFYNQTAVLFTSLTLAIAIGYPLFVKFEGVSSLLVGAIIAVTCMSGIVEYFLYDKLKVLLTADQKLYIITCVTIAGVIVQTGLKVVFAANAFNILLVQAVPAFVYVLRVAVLWIYVKRNYPELNKKAKPNFAALKKRWSVFIHQIAGLVVNNTDMVILATVTKQLGQVVIYSVYNLVFRHLYTLMTNTFSESALASFGQMISRDDLDGVRKGYSGYECLYYMVVAVIYSITAVMILPFVNIYTRNAKDALPYFDVKLAVLFVVINLANNLRVPGNTMINAKGYYKETQYRAMLEAGLNLTVSLILVNWLGMYGVLLGTVVSFAYRTTDIILFSNKRVLKQKPWRTLKRGAMAVAVVAIEVAALARYAIASTDGWGMWIVNAVIAGVSSIALTLIANYIFERQTLKMVIEKVTAMIKSKRAKKVEKA